MPSKTPQGILNSSMYYPQNIIIANIITNQITNGCSHPTNSHCHRPSLPGFQTQGFMSLLAR